MRCEVVVALCLLAAALAANPYVTHKDKLKAALGTSDSTAVPSQELLTLASSFSESEIAATPGGKVLVAAKKTATFKQLFDAFIAESTVNSFNWAPGRENLDLTFGLLDGTATEGNCKVISTALLGLWMWPWPFGLGHHSERGSGGAIAVVKMYKGVSEGFVSAHPLVGVRNLLPNIFTPGSLATAQPLYYWAYHYVVDFDQKLYDPSYKTIFANANAMYVAVELYAPDGGQQPTDNVEVVEVIQDNAAMGTKGDKKLIVMKDAKRVGPYNVKGGSNSPVKAGCPASHSCCQHSLHAERTRNENRDKCKFCCVPDAKLSVKKDKDYFCPAGADSDSTKCNYLDETAVRFTSRRHRTLSKVSHILSPNW